MIVHAMVNAERQHQTFPEDGFISLLMARSDWRKLYCMIIGERELVQWHMHKH